MATKRGVESGQALSEFALVIGAFTAIVAGIFLFGAVIVQQWGVSRTAEWLGRTITQQGYYDGKTADDLRSFASGIGVAVNTENGTDVTVIVTPGDPSVKCQEQNATTCIYHNHTIPDPTNPTTSGVLVRYGDHVKVTITLTINPPLLQIPIVGSIARMGGPMTVTGSWSGISQLDSPHCDPNVTDGDGCVPTATPPAPDAKGFLVVSVVGSDRTPITGVHVDPTAKSGPGVCIAQPHAPGTVILACDPGTYAISTDRSGTVLLETCSGGVDPSCGNLEIRPGRTTTLVITVVLPSPTPIATP